MTRATTDGWYRVWGAHREGRPSSARWRAALLLALLAFVPAQGWGQAPEPVVYTLGFPSLEEHVAAVEASFPTDGRGTVELMMPVWSPGYYRIEDYAGKVTELSARGPDGAEMPVTPLPPNRWRVDTGGADRVLVSYRLNCDRSFVTANWVSPDLGVLAGPATFVTVASDLARPREVRFELPASWRDVATGLMPAEGGRPHTFRAESYDELVDAPFVAGALEVHEVMVDGVPHELVDVGAPEGWDGAAVVRDLGAMVRRTLPLWGELPYRKYVFLNVFRRGGGGLEHANSTLLTTNAQRVVTERGYRSWLSFAAHEYVHALNVKRLRPVELGPFDYEAPPHTPSLWLAEGVTSYLAELALVRAGLTTPDDFLAAVSGAIGELQASPGRLLQTLEQSSLEVWTNSNSGVGAQASTVSYYVKGEVLGFLLDAEVRSATRGRRSLDDVVRAAYERYGGERGYTPEEFQAVVADITGADLGGWFRRSVASTEELDYSIALEWFGLSFDGAEGWSLGVRDDATDAQEEHFAALVRS